ncbi:methyl-accepting chemotaxis protein [Bradyrhizobium sp. JR6.1]
MISKIAGQTNMFALKARIEACRAGDFGKGFAVIAQEVKTLAVQASTASTEIATQIDAVERATEASIEDIDLTCQTIDEITHAGYAITACVREQGDAARRINRYIPDAARFAQAVAGSKGAFEVTNNHTRQSAQSLSALAQSLGSCRDELQANASSLRSQILVTGA